MDQHTLLRSAVTVVYHKWLMGIWIETYRVLKVQAAGASLAMR